MGTPNDRDKNEDDQIFYDDITGAQLDTKGGLAARKEELDWLRPMRKGRLRGVGRKPAKLQ